MSFVSCAYMLYTLFYLLITSLLIKKGIIMWIKASIFIIIYKLYNIVTVVHDMLVNVFLVVCLHIIFTFGYAFLIVIVVEDEVSSAQHNMKS